jgi:hypothetical protein
MPLHRACAADLLSPAEDVGAVATGAGRALLEKLVRATRSQLEAETAVELARPPEDGRCPFEAGWS